MNKASKSVSIDLRWVAVALVAVIVAMLFMWQPWVGSSQRTVRATGEATLKAAPDEFVFQPTYQFNTDNKETALAELTKKSTEVTAKLKELGIADSAIKTDSGGYDFPIYPEPAGKESTYTLQFTVTVTSQELAQKVQDYLITTTPTGAISPQPSFSKAKQQDLEDQARTQATEDARAKAQELAANLGFSLGKVKSVVDNAGFGGAVPFAVDAARGSESLAVQPGEKELNYSVTVEYYIR